MRENVTPRRTVAARGSADVAYDPFSVDVMTDPYPVYRELRARHRACRRCPSTTRSRCTRFDDVWKVLTDRERFSIFEGPVFHRERAAAPPRRRARPHGPRVRCPRSRCSTRPRTPSLRQAMIDPFRPRAVTPLEPDVRALARARLDALADRDVVRRAPRLRVAGRRAGGRAPTRRSRSRTPSCSVAWVNVFVRARSRRRRDQRRGAGGARRAARVPRRRCVAGATRATRGDGPPDLIDDLLRVRRRARSARRPRDRGAAVDALHRRVGDAAQDRRRRRLRALARTPTSAPRSSPTPTGCRTRSRRCCATNCRCSSWAAR